MVEEPNLSGGERSESAAALAGAWESLADAKVKRRRIRLIAAEFMSERAPDVFGEDVERSMRPKS